MTDYKEIFMNYLVSEEIKFTEKNENVVQISYSGENIESISVFVIFDDDGDSIAQFKCWGIANFTGKISQGYDVCNMLNSQYRWVKFYIDDDNDVVCSCDTYFDDYTCGTNCLSIVKRMVHITDEAYPEFMRTLNS